MFTLGENVSNSVSTNEEDSRVNKNEALIEIVNSASCIPVALDMDVDINNLQLIILSEENENSATLETETLGTAETHINTSKIYDSTCRADVEPFKDFDLYDVFEGL